jgi:hypothetical protein
VKGKLDFDPDGCEYGPATLAVRRILRDWVSVDWFTAPKDPGGEHATAFFKEHVALARAWLRTVQPREADARFPGVTVRTTRGQWSRFRAWCDDIRFGSRPWDWKYGALKPLAHEHSSARRWNLDEQAELRPDGVPRPGDLVVKVDDRTSYWAVFPKVDLGPVPDEHDRRAASWYLSHADMDFRECLEWQLAERSDDMRANPFVPLTRCYAKGWYPFSLGPAEVVLFAFE